MGMKWSEAVKELRKKLLLTQVELAEKLGVSFATVNRWENDEHEPTMKLKRKIMALLKDHGIVE